MVADFIIGDVLWMNRCHGRQDLATRGGDGEDYHRCAGRADQAQQCAAVAHKLRPIQILKGK